MEILIILFSIFILLGFLYLFIRIFHIHLWFKARQAGLKVSLTELFCMNMRGVNAKNVILPAIMLHQNGIQVDTGNFDVEGAARMDDLEYLDKLAEQEEQRKLEAEEKGSVDLSDLEAHALAGGDPRKVALNMIADKKAGRKVSFRRSAEIDLPKTSKPTKLRRA